MRFSEGEPEFWQKSGSMCDTGGTKNLFFDAQTHGSVFRGVGDMCENKKRPSRPGDNMILSPGWARIPSNPVCTADFTEVKHQKWPHLWFTNVQDVGRTHEATFY